MFLVHLEDVPVDNRTSRILHHLLPVLQLQPWKQTTSIKKLKLNTAYNRNLVKSRKNFESTKSSLPWISFEHSRKTFIWSLGRAAKKGPFSRPLRSVWWETDFIFWKTAEKETDGSQNLSSVWNWWKLSLLMINI